MPHSLYSQEGEESLMEQLLSYKQLVMDHRMDLPEFQEIRSWAQKKGLRVWLVGGSATAFGRSVKRNFIDPRNAQEAPRFEKKPKLDFWEVFDLFQDVDLVLDGSAQDCIELQRHLVKTFRYSVRRRYVWEVIPLKPQMYPNAKVKRGLLDENFAKQNTDLYSLALLELSDPPAGVDIVQHARRLSFDKASFAPNEIYLHWLTNKNPYLRNPRHNESYMASIGLNPPYMSVLRYLVKMDRDGLEIDPQSMGFLKMNISLKDFENLAIQRELNDGKPFAQKITEKLIGKITVYFYQLIVGARDSNKVITWLQELGVYEALENFPVYKIEGPIDTPDFTSIGTFSDVIIDEIFTRPHGAGIRDDAPSGHIHSKERVPLNAVHHLLEGDVIEAGSVLLNEQKPGFLVDPSRPHFKKTVNNALKAFKQQTAKPEAELFKNKDAAKAFISSITTLSLQAVKDDKMPGYSLLPPLFRRDLSTLDPCIVASVLLSQFDFPSKIIHVKNGAHPQWGLFFQIPSGLIKNQNDIEEDWLTGQIWFPIDNEGALDFDGEVISSLLESEKQIVQFLKEHTNEHPSLWFDGEKHKNRDVCEGAFR